MYHKTQGMEYFIYLKFNRIRRDFEDYSKIIKILQKTNHFINQPTIIGLLASFKNVN